MIVIDVVIVGDIDVTGVAPFGHWLVQWPFFLHLLHVILLNVFPSSPGVT